MECPKLSFNCANYKLNPNWIAIILCKNLVSFNQNELKANSPVHSIGLLAMVNGSISMSIVVSMRTNL